MNFSKEHIEVNIVSLSTQYDEMGERYLEVGKDHWFSSKPDLWTRSKITKFIPSFENKIVMDAGCGSGIDTQSYLKTGAHAVLAFDPSSLMLAKATDAISPELANHVEFKQGTFESIPFPDECADIVIGVYSVHYCLNLDLAYAELLRVLKSGGRMVFTCTHPSEMTNIKQSPFKGQEIALFKIYNKCVEVMKPTHTLTEYFSPFLLQNFHLENIEEWYPEDPLSGKEMKHPKLLAFCAIKK